MFMGDEKPKSLHECFERLKKGCELLYEECNYPKDYSYFNPPATEEELVGIEKHLGFRLPDSYREFIKFANGATIMGTSATIYGLDRIGISDPMVPDGYLTIGEYIGDGERLALSKADGEVYTCYNGNLASLDLEDIVLSLLEECEECIEEHYDEVQKASQTPEEIQRDEEEVRAVAEKYLKMFEERKNAGK